MTRIRVHGKSKRSHNSVVYCYPITKVPDPPKAVFERYERLSRRPNSRSQSNPPTIPDRKSSKTNTFLRLHSSGKEASISPRHHMCFHTKNGDSSSSKLSPKSTRKSVALRQSKSTSDIMSRRSAMYPLGRNAIIRSPLSPRRSTPSPVAFGRCFHPEPKPIEKRKLQASYKDIAGRLVRSPDLAAPKEVKKIQSGQTKSKVTAGGSVKSTNALYSSVKNGKHKDEKSLKVTVAISARGKELLKASADTSKLTKSTTSKSSTSKLSRTSSTTLTSKDKTKRINGSTSSLTKKATRSSSETTKRSSNTVLCKPVTICKPMPPPTEIVVSKPKKEIVEASKASKKIKDDDFKTSDHKDVIKYLTNGFEHAEFGNIDEFEEEHIGRSDNFFQNLFLRDLSPTPSVASSYRSTSVLEKARMFNNAFYKNEYNQKAPDTYLFHRRPVSESRFKTLDRDFVYKTHRFRDMSWPGSYVSDQVEKFDSLLYVEDRDGTCRVCSPEINEMLRIRSSSEPPPKVILTETSRPVSPESPRRSRSTSPINVSRSPACRRIHSARRNAICEKIAKIARARSAGEADRLPYKEDNDLYNEYIHSIINRGSRSDRFKELNKFYENLERVGELERATSSSDLRPRRKDEDVIDFDRWKSLRAKERAETELKLLYRKLYMDQKEKDFLFRPKDSHSLKWQRENDTGLRSKEKSVEDLKEHFKKLAEEESELENLRRRDLNIRKDVYKPLWRGNSVVNLASSMVEKRNPSKSLIKKNDNIGFHGYELSSRLWSSLSSEQVNKLKNQLTEIYSTTGKKDSSKEDYVINVPPKSKSTATNLVVRSSSLLSANQISKPDLKYSYKADSIGSINVGTVHKSKSDTYLTESEKRRLSQNLCREVMNKVASRRNQAVLVLPKETLGALAAANTGLGPSSPLPESPKLLKVKKNIISEPDSLTKMLEYKNSCTSETESASSDASNRTVIFKGDVDSVQSKVDFFEKAKLEKIPGAVIHVPRDPTPPDSPQDEVATKVEQNNNSHRLISESDLKEILDENKLNNPDGFEDKDVERPCFPADYSGSSLESLVESRSPSPNPEKYWRAYMSLVRAGEVRKLKRKFEQDVNINDFEVYPLRRIRSDPEITRNILAKDFSNNKDKVQQLTWKFENKQVRGRPRNISPIPKIPLKSKAMLMPRINVISKMAALKREQKTSQSSYGEKRRIASLYGCKYGEVDKLREHFEIQNLSMMGRMYTSEPDVRELKDISPYLMGSWYAHKYPKKEDNSEKGIKVPLKSTKKIRPKSESPIRKQGDSSKTSILKSKSSSHVDKFKGQPFDPSIHRPRYRYQPEMPQDQKQHKERRCWSSSPVRPTVTFKGDLLLYIITKYLIYKTYV